MFRRRKSSHELRVCLRCRERIAEVDISEDGNATWTGCACHIEWLANLDWRTTNVTGSMDDNWLAQLQKQLDADEAEFPEIAAASERFARACDDIRTRDFQYIQPVCVHDDGTSHPGNTLPCDRT
jgi:hypothetical protein